jgi:hypothetical protein
VDRRAALAAQEVYSPRNPAPSFPARSFMIQLGFYYEFKRNSFAFFVHCYRLVHAVEETFAAQGLGQSKALKSFLGAQ